MKTQLQMIIHELVTNGEVSRNWCLARYCSRLGARIQDLKKQGWLFETETRNGDYFYIATYIPAIYKKEVGREVLPQYKSEYIKQTVKI